MRYPQSAPPWPLAQRSQGNPKLSQQPVRPTCGARAPRLYVQQPTQPLHRGRRAAIIGGRGSLRSSDPRRVNRPETSPQHPANTGYLRTVFAPRSSQAAPRCFVRVKAATRTGLATGPRLRQAGASRGGGMAGQLCKRRPSAAQQPSCLALGSTAADQMAGQVGAAQAARGMSPVSLGVRVCSRVFGPGNTLSEVRLKLALAFEIIDARKCFLPAGVPAAHQNQSVEVGRGERRVETGSRSVVQLSSRLRNSASRTAGPRAWV